MTSKTNLFLFLAITSILITSPLVSGNAFAEDKNKKNHQPDNCVSLGSIPEILDCLKNAAKNAFSASSLDALKKALKLLIDSVDEERTARQNADNKLQNQINSIQLVPGLNGINGTDGIDGSSCSINGTIVSCTDGTSSDVKGPPGPKGDSGITKTVHLEPVTCGPYVAHNGIGAFEGWCPNGGDEMYFIEDPDVKETSVIVITLDYLDGTWGQSCSINHVTEGEGFLQYCAKVSPGTSLNYAIINP